MSEDVTRANEKFTDRWKQGANAMESTLILAIGQTENTRFQVYGIDAIPKDRVIKILRHVADMLETPEVVTVIKIDTD